MFVPATVFPPLTQNSMTRRLHNFIKLNCLSCYNYHYIVCFIVDAERLIDCFKG